MKLFRLPADQLPAQSADLDTLARRWFRESLLLPVALYLDAHEAIGSSPGEAQVSLVQRFLARTNGIVFLDTRDALPGLALAMLPVDIAKPSLAEQRAGWNSALGSSAPDSVAMLAEKFHLDLATIQRIAHAAGQANPQDDRPLPQRIWDACVVHTRPRLENLA